MVLFMELIEIKSKASDDAPIHASNRAQAGLNAILRLFRLWDLTDEQGAVLLDTSVASYRRWKAGRSARLGRDQMARISNLLGIHKALRLIFAEPSRAYVWIKKPNERFGGESALDVMLRGDLSALMRVRRLLDAERGAW